MSALGTSYRLYCLDGAGHISFADLVEAEDDAETLTQARELKDGAQLRGLGRQAAGREPLAG